MAQSPNTLMTAEDLLELQDGLRHELIRGELTTMTPSGSPHGRCVIRITRILSNYIIDQNLGEAFAAETGFLIQTDPDTVLAPDFAYVSKARIPSPFPKGFFPGAPDLAVEVLSPHDRAVEVDDKIQKWLDTGALHVWVVNLNRRTITIHRKNNHPRVLRAADKIDDADLFPGFTANVDDLFPPLDA